MEHLKKVILLLLVVLVLAVSGCATKTTVKVNSIVAAPAQETGKHYFLTGAQKDQPSSELYFMEFRRYFDYLLQKQGYMKADDLAHADIDIRFQFGVSGGRTGVYTYSWPIYETYAGDIITITEKTTNANGSVTTTKRTVQIPPSVRQVGTNYETRSYTEYNRHADLTAYPVVDGKVPDKARPIWSINMQSIGESNDLREVMPYLAAASAPFIGKNSGRQQAVKLTPDNPLVVELRSLIVK
jgi:hypothetical protein